MTTMHRPKRLEKVPLDKIDLITWLPAREDMGRLVDLAKSIKVRGDVDVPLKLRPAGAGRYELVWGYRRFAAAKLAGLKEISSIIENMDDEEVMRQCALENLLRKRKNALEEGEFFQVWSRRTGKKYDQIARELGINPKYIYNRVELLKLSPMVIERLKKLPTDRNVGILPLLYLLKIKDPVTQTKVFNEFVENNLSVRELRDRIENMLQESPPPRDKEVEQEKGFYDLTIPLSPEDLSSLRQWLIKPGSDRTSKLFTHFDTPALFLDNGKTIDQYPPSWFIGKCVVVPTKCRSGDRLITLDLVRENLDRHHLPYGMIVFLHTGWIKHIGSDEFFHHPVIDESLAEWLVERRVKILGVDMPDLERGESKSIHKLLLSNDVLVLENVGDMSPIVGRNVFVYALPLNIKAGTAVPARVIARTRKKKTIRRRNFVDNLYKEMRVMQV